jgi:hypothetical protein
MTPAADRERPTEYAPRAGWLAFAAALSTLAFPAVWYGASVFVIWLDFTKAMAAESHAREIYVWRQYGVVIADSMFVAAGTWLAHCAVLLADRRHWRKIPSGFRGLASALAGALTFVASRVLIRLDDFMLSIGLLLVAVSVSTLIVPWIMRRLVMDRRDSIPKLT